jgi:hypothetical protein
VRDFANILIFKELSWGSDDCTGGIAMSILDHPEAQALLADATVTPEAVEGCQDRLTAFLQRYSLAIPVFPTMSLVETDIKG